MFCQKSCGPTEKPGVLPSAPCWRSNVNPVGPHEEENNFICYHSERLAFHFEVLQAGFLKYCISISISELYFPVWH